MSSKLWEKGFKGASSSFDAIGPSGANQGNLTQVFFLCSDHGNLCVLYARCVQWAECLVRNAQGRESLKILKPKF